MTARFKLGSVLIALAGCQAFGWGCGRAKPSSDAGSVSDGGSETAGAMGGAGVAGQAGAANGGQGGELDGGGTAGGSATDGAADVPPEAEPTSPPVDCGGDPERCAFCTGRFAMVTLHDTETVRGTWQYNPGGAYVSLPEAGYPCAAFLYDGPVRPSLDDDHWVGAPDGAFISFSQVSTLKTTDYRTAQFRYFRSLVYIPPNVAIDSFRVTPSGVDDSVHLVLYNSKYPNGVSPMDAGPSDPRAGACAGNGDSSWDLKDYAQAGEINLVLLVHADLSPTVSSLGKTDVTVNSASIPLYDCVAGVGPPVEPGPEAPDAGP